MPTTYIPMGTYTVKPKNTAAETDNIISPDVETCIVLVLDSPQGIAVAHIDSPLIAAETTENMVRELNHLGESKLTARMYGGEYGTPFGSQSIANQISSVLKKNQIPTSHTDYMLNSAFIMAAGYTILRVASCVGPESYLASMACAGLAYLAGGILKSALKLLPEKKQPGFLASNINVGVNIRTGVVTLEKDNKPRAIQHLLNAKGTLINWNAIHKRAQLDVINPKNKSVLAMLRLN